MAKPKAQVVNNQGKVTGYILGNGKRVSMAQAVRMAEQGTLPGKHAVRPKGQRPYIRSDPDGQQRNNLAELPKAGK